MIPLIWRQIAGDRSNYYCINYNSVLTRRNPGKKISSITHKDSNKRITMRNNSIHCLISFILRIILLGILPYKTITNDWTRINVTTYRNSTIHPYTIPITKYSNPTNLRSNCTNCTSWTKDDKEFKIHYQTYRRLRLQFAYHVQSI